MERGLLWSGLAVGCLGWLCSFLLTAFAAPRATTDGPADQRRFPFLTALLPLLVWLLTLPEKPPFGEGHGWGNGFLVGGIAALLGAWIATRVDWSSATPLTRAAAVTAPAFAALAVIAIPLLWMRPTVIDALVGIACGWFVVSFVVQETLTRESPGDGADADAANRLTSSLTLFSGMSFTVLLCAICALGVYRDFVVKSVTRGTFSAVALTLAAGVPLAVLISVLLGNVLRRRSAKTDSKLQHPTLNNWGLPAGFLFFLWIANLVAIKVVNSTAVFVVAMIGVLAGALGAWLISDSVKSSPEQKTDSGAEAAVVAPLAILVLLGAFMTAFQLLQGFGAGIVMLAAWPVAALALVLRTGDSNTAASGVAGSQQMALPLLRWLVFGVILVLFRLFSERYGSTARSLEMADNYAFFSVVAGVFLPVLLCRILWRTPGDGPLPSKDSGVMLARWVMVAIVGLAALAIMLVLWGTKIALPLFFGLGLCCVLGTTNLPTVRSLAGTALLALGLALALVQWANKTIPIADLSRTERMRALVYISIGLLVLIVMLDVGGRVLQRLHRRQPAAP